jgi:hypothetical protein
MGAFATRGMRGVRGCLPLLLVAAWVAPTLAHAGETANEVWPGLDIYYSLDDRLRMYLLASQTNNREGHHSETDLGLHLDVTLKPILGKRREKPDWERQRYLWARIGYVHITSVTSGTRAGPEDRGVLELTARIPLPARIWVENRGRFDLRWIAGDYSTRFRYRLKVQRELTGSGMPLVPYGSVELFYDTRFDTWNRQLYELGVEVSINNRFRIEPYIARQNDSRSSPEHVNAARLTLKFYF